MWTMLAREFRSVRPDAHGDPRIVVHLMPQPLARSTISEAGGKSHAEGPLHTNL